MTDDEKAQSVLQDLVDCTPCFHCARLCQRRYSGYIFCDACHVWWTLAGNLLIAQMGPLGPQGYYGS